MSGLLRVGGWTAVLALSFVVGCSESHTSGDTDAAAIDDDAGRPPGIDSGPLVGVDAGGPIEEDAGEIVIPIFDGGTPPDPADGGTPPDPADGGPAGVACGTETCSGADVCCVTSAGGGMVTTACTAPDACMGGSLTCDGPEDCGTGEACCGMRTGSGGSAACVAESDCGFGRLCHTAADCPTGDMCCPFMGLGVCSSFGCFGGP